MERMTVIFHLVIFRHYLSVSFSNVFFLVVSIRRHAEVVRLTFPHIFSVIMMYPLNKIQFIFYEEEMSVRLYAQV